MTAEKLLERLHEIEADVRAQCITVHDAIVNVCEAIKEKAKNDVDGQRTISAIDNDILRMQRDVAIKELANTMTQRDEAVCWGKALELCASDDYAPLPEKPDWIK